MTHSHRSSLHGKGSGQLSGSGHRTGRSRREPYRWLGVGAVAVGVALTGTMPIAHADTSASNTSQGSADQAPAPQKAGTTSDVDAPATTPEIDKKAKPAKKTTSPGSKKQGDNKSPSRNRSAQSKTAPASPAPKLAAPAAAVQNAAPARGGSAAFSSAAPAPIGAVKVAALSPVSAPAPVAAATVESHVATTTAATATPLGSVLKPLNEVLSSLSALVDGKSVGSPLMWVFAAMTRRQIGTNRTSTLPAVTTTSGQLLPGTAVPAATTSSTNTAPTVTSVTVGQPDTYGAVKGKITASDPDGNTVSFSSPVTTTKGTAKVSSSGSFTYTPTAQARHAAAATNAPSTDTTDTFTVTVSDGVGGTASVPITVKILPANKGLSTATTVAKPDPVSGVQTGKIKVTDADGDTPTFTKTDPAKGSVVVNPDGTFNYTPTAAARDTARVTSTTDTDKFKVTVDDGHGSVKTVTVTVTIAPSDTAPVNGAYTVAEPSTSTGAVKGVVTARDNENDSMKFQGPTKTDKGGTLSVGSSGAFTYTPTSAARHAASADNATAQDKTDTFTVTVVDKYGATTAIPVTVNILGKNTAPTGGKATVGKPDYTSGVVTGKVTASDADKDAVTYSGSTDTGRGVVSVNPDGTFSYTPTGAARLQAGASGAPTADKQVTFTVMADDGHGGTIPVQVTAPISRNRAPVRKSVDWDISGATTITGAVTATDPDGDAVTYSGSTSTTKGSVTVNPDGTFTYNPTAAASHAAARTNAPGEDQQDTFTVNASDGRGAVTPISVIVPVMSTDTAPSVANPNYSVNQNSQLTGNVLNSASDPDGDAMTVSLGSGPAHGSLNLNADGSFSYTPVSSYSGGDSFNYMVDDGHGMASPGTANITVNYVAPPSTGPTLSQKVATFVSNTRGQSLANPDGSYRGECVSLVRQYLEQALNIRTGAWGNAIDYKNGGSGGNQLAARGFTWHTDRSFQDGDILVFAGNDSTSQTNANGHIGIWSGGQLYDQNDGWRANATTANYTPFDNTAPYGGISHAFIGYWRPPASAGGGGGGGATSGNKNGTGTVIQLVNVRNDPSTNGPIIAQYQPGQTFNYDSWVIANGYDWLSYISYSGVRRYVAESTADGSIVYVTGGEFH